MGSQSITNTALVVQHKPDSTGDSTTAITALQQASSGGGSGLYVESANSSATAAVVRGAGTLLDLKNSAGTSMFAVSQAGILSGPLTLTKLAFVVATLTDAATITTDAALGNLFRCAAVAGNRTLGAPTNPTDGQEARWELTASGAQRTVSVAVTAGGFALTAAVASADVVIAQNKTAVISAIYSTTVTKWILLGATVTS